MKKILLFLVVIITFSCNQGKNKNSNDNNLIIGKKYEKQIPEFIVDERMNSILTKVIEKEINCPYYIKEKSCFYFILKKASSNISIIIEVGYIDRPSLKNAYGIFNFKKHLFICKGDSCEDLLKRKKDSFIIVEDRDNEKKSCPPIDDTHSQWVFQFSEKTITEIGHNTCVK
jgi:hypothetical protein